MLIDLSNRFDPNYIIPSLDPFRIFRSSSPRMTISTTVLAQIGAVCVGAICINILWSKFGRYNVSVMGPPITAPITDEMRCQTHPHQFAPPCTPKFLWWRSTSEGPMLGRYY